MLKALELLGFKSFADKTRFEFPAGITVVVGPNGSGKSNVVDAIKWVLGEQSAKSLRGKDMSDVIFKGSGSATGRKPMNTAEATLVIDNSDGRIAIDAPEVHVTRRVYRSGEGEYLINRQPCRLKDIKDLFRGTGAGADAYSLIEQGKVDRLLQASPKDRRAIFEEAAGISRFKAKKIEAQRRLERVDQNLLRLSDIVDEVESRLRSVRSQASKATRYREYSERLQQLRTQVGLADWRRLSEHLEGLETELQTLRDDAGAAAAQAESLEARSLEVEVDVTNANESIRNCENQIARNRERIATCQSTIQHELARVRDLEGEESRHRENLATMSNRAGDVQQRLADITAGMQDAEADCAAKRQLAEQEEQQLNEIVDSAAQRRTENEERRETYLEQMRAVAKLGNRASACQSQLSGTQSTADRCKRRREELRDETEIQDIEVRQLDGAEQKLNQQLADKTTALEEAQAVLVQQRDKLAQLHDALSHLQGRYSGASQRAQVLEDLEKRREGLSTGVKEVLTRAGEESVFHGVRGLVADLIQVDVDMAALIDVALGDKAHHIVVEGKELLNQLQAEAISVTGRVGFVRLDAPEGPRAAEKAIDPRQFGGVIARADRVVNVDAEFLPLVRRLLGATWFVDSLKDAVRLNSIAGGPSTRFVTRAGELVEPDGTVIVGPRHATVGLVSRRSELRALATEIDELERQLSQIKTEVKTQQTAITDHETGVLELEGEQRAVAAELSDGRIQTQTAKQRHDQLKKQLAAIEAEWRTAQTQQQREQEELEQLQTELSESESSVAALESEIAAADQQVELIDKQRQQHLQQATAAKVELAKSEQYLQSLRAQVIQFEDDHRERNKAITNLRDEMHNCRERRKQSERTVLRNTSDVAELSLRKEKFASDVAIHNARREELAAERSSLSAEIQSARKKERKLEERQHQVELSAGEVRHERNTLAERLREDYGIELGQLTHEPTDEEQDERAAVEEEIDSLRRKINNIGAVNMDALEELDDLEERYGSISRQYQDLTQAKESLEKIISKINADSRRLFSETLEIIRKNFQVLYRKAFGGGRADIVLEEGADILECGVDIVANPPGKPQFNNSLLSGGEKALTAVSLLLAIFQFRPSPFCVLDEVDAPFDEANIGRFIDVLSEFLGWTKFVIVTHSKKTMTAATTLYGVTMQESGVSKQVSVKFDDVSEDGEISADALDREESKGDDERGAA